jgi:LEA14-like dessication related protein
VAKLVLTILGITQSLCSRVVKNLLTKAGKFWSYRKFVRLKAFAILFYQMIALTITNSGLETIIDMKAVTNLQNKLTVTFCLKNHFQFSKRVKSLLIHLYFNNPIGCQFENKTKPLFLKCSHLTNIVESVTTLSQKCRSYFSQLLNNKSMLTLMIFIS